MFIDVKDLVKTYGEGEAKVFALDHAGLELEKGKICVILGPSGSGKSTLLNMLVAMGGMGRYGLVRTLLRRSGAIDDPSHAPSGKPVAYGADHSLLLLYFLVAGAAAHRPGGHGRKPER